MFATMYSTQAILPQLGASSASAPRRPGSRVSVVVGALAVGGVVLGAAVGPHRPPRVAVLASGAAGATVAVRRAGPELRRAAGVPGLQGLCMPGPPHRRRAVRDRGVRAAHRRAGDGLLRLRAGARAACWAGSAWRCVTAATAGGWRWPPSRAPAGGDAGHAPFAAARRRAPALGAPVAQHAARGCSQPHPDRRHCLAGAGLFFAFVGVFSLIDFRLEARPSRCRRRSSGSSSCCG